MQEVRVELSIPIPSEYVVISKVELQDLQKQQLTGIYWSMKDLEKRVNRKSEWIKENILYPPKFKRILDAESGGFVFYATKMAKFLDDNFHRIFQG